jgi:ATP-binding cassette subfamily C (CFTR/MRP) protein 1
MVAQGAEKDFKELDPVGIATNTTLHDDPVAENRESSSGDEFEKAGFDEKYPNETTKSKLDHGARRMSSSTDRTDLSDIKSKAEEKKRSRRDRWNPLKIKPPPIPEERQVCKEYTASFWSRLTWQWVTPLMSVCSIYQILVHFALTYSPDRVFPPFGNH